MQTFMKALKDLNIPTDILFSPEHIWLKKDADTFIAGISDYAQDQLGEVLYADLPTLGEYLQANAEFGTLESVKTVTSLYMPISGEVIEINENLADLPNLLNSDCYSKGWIIRIKADNPQDAEKLLSSEQYLKKLAN